MDDPVGTLLHAKIEKTVLLAGEGQIDWLLNHHIEDSDSQKEIRQFKSFLLNESRFMVPIFGIEMRCFDAFLGIAGTVDCLSFDCETN